MKLRRSSLFRSTILSPLALIPVITIGLLSGELDAASLYWDSNGTTAGAGATATGNWGTSNFWNTDSAGGTGTFSTSIATTDTAVFSAGTDATTGTVTLNANTTVGGLTIEEGGLTLVSSTSAKSLTVSSNVTFGKSLVIGSATAASNVNLLLGTNTLTQTLGTLDLYGANTMASAALKGGVTFLGNASALGGGTVTIGDTAANSTYTMNPRSITFARPIVLDSGTFTNTTTIQNTSFQNSIMQSAVTSAGAGAKTLNINSVATTGNGSMTWNTGSINHTGILNLQNTRNGGTGTSGTVTISSVIGSNVTNVNVNNTATDGTQTVTIAGANTYTGNTTVNSNAKLILGASDVIPDGSGKGNLTVSGTLDLRATTAVSAETVNGLSGSGTITRSGATGTSSLTIGGNNATSTFSGSILGPAGTVSVTKIGSGTLTLSGSSSYTGTTSVNAGTLLLKNNSATGSGAVNVGSATAATLLTDGAFTIANAIQTIANPTTGTHTLGGNSDNTSTFSGAILIAGDVLISQVATTGGNALNLTGGIGANNTGNHTLTFAGPGKINVSTTPISNGSIGTVAVKVTGGDVTFSTVNTYGGGTTVQGGSLTLQNVASLNDASTVEVTSGAALVLDFTGTDTIAALTFDGLLQTSGTWGAVGSGADHEDSRITGTGKLLIVPQTFIWTDTGADEKWSNALNWDVNGVPTSLATLQFQAAANPALTNDLASGSTVARILFQSDAPNYTINGTNSLNITTGITNSSANVQILGFPIVLASAGAFPINVGSQGIELNGDISGTVGLGKSGASTLKLSGTNTYSGTTTIFAGDLWATGASSLPSGTTLAFANTNGSALLDITGLNQTLAGMTFGTQTTGSNQVNIVGDSSTSLTLSPATLAFTTAAAAAANTLSFSMTTLGSFTYNNSSGIISVLHGGSTNTGSQTVTLSATSNSITAATLNVGTLGGGDVNSGNVSTLNFGAANTLNASTLNIGNSGSRSSGLVRFAPGLTSPTLTIAGVTGGSSTATLNIGSFDNFASANTYSATFDTTNDGGTGAGTLNAQFGTVLIGREVPSSNSGARSVNNTSSFKMGNGTVSANTMTIGQINSRTTNTGAYTFTDNASYQLTGGTANIGNLILATSAYTDPLAGTNTLSGTVTLNSGATLNAATIQKGTIATPSAGTLTVVSRINWNDGTIGNLAGGNLSISGVGLLLASGTHTFNISSSQTGTVSSIISGTGTLTKSGAGTLTLGGANTYVGQTVVAAGILETTSTFLDDTSSVEITSGAKLNLNFSGTDKVDSLTFDGIAQTAGTTYGATGSGAAVIDDVHFSGTGKLQVGVIADPFGPWAATPAFGLAIGDQDKTDDPDGDGRSNLLEFALDGNPAIGGANTKERSAISTISGSDYLTLTVPMRVGATFSGPGDLVSAVVDKVIYTVQGSTDLSDFTTTGVTEVTPALSSGMTAPSTGWEYRTFRLTNPLTGNPKGFLRVNAVAAP